MGRLKSVFEPLDKAADAVIAESGDESIEIRCEILDTLNDGLGLLANAMGVMTWGLEKAENGEKAAEAIFGAVAAVRKAGEACGDARRALQELPETGPENTNVKP